MLKTVPGERKWLVSNYFGWISGTNVGRYIGKRARDIRRAFVVMVVVAVSVSEVSINV